MKKSLTIIGAGAWGSALAIVLSDKFDQIFLVAKNQNSIEKIGIQHHALSKPFSNNIFFTFRRW